MKSRNEVIQEVERDLTNEVYKQFPVVGNKLRITISKMRIINGSLSNNDIKVLQDNSYILRSQRSFEY